ncbi:MAG TPA: ketoacyl-ACP synthase III [Flavobacterium sp.]|jgi:3-oxoacyl-[acyl-carrier-protein] synthase-3
MNQEFKGIEIRAVSSCVPKNTIKNDFFESLLSPKEMRAFEKTVGINERRWTLDNVTASDLGFVAATRLFEGSPELKENIGCLIFLSQTPDYKIPFSSNILQTRLNLNKNILCLDINAGCAGFIQGLNVAFSIASNWHKTKVLLIVAETMSKIISNKDRSTSMLFGDGASAIIIEKTGNDTAEAVFNIFSDGDYADAIKIPDSGFRNEASIESFKINDDGNGNFKNSLQLFMDGPGVFDFTLREVAPGIENLFQSSQNEIEQVDFFLLHQSNKFIIYQIASRLNIPKEKVLLNIDKFGNTSGVSIPLLLSSFKNEIADKKNLLFSGYGVGLNWGNCLLKNASIKITDIVEI